MRMQNRKRRRREGLTIIELMVVLLIVAFIGSGAAIAVNSQLKSSRVKQTRNDARALVGLAEGYMMDHTGECPTVAQLKSEGLLSKQSRDNDAWDRPFVITCENDEVQVVSAGADESDTSDDIKIPE